MTARKWVRAAAAALAALLVVAAPVAAEVEWCDTGSPPPNDFCLRPTGAGSVNAPPNWLNSTTNGAALQATYDSRGTIDRSQVSTLQGGVANGMSHATENARPFSTPCPTTGSVVGPPATRAGAPAGR